ncbi:MAG: LamG domain-containing protein [Verrucomicrobia bacterium]|nr:LamG domain-containing protein [Verrucomicrobiota bacterium]
MNIRTHLMPMVAVAAFSLAGGGCCTTIVAPTAKEIGRVFSARQAGWTVTDAGYGGATNGNWSYALAGRESWQDYRVSATVSLKRPADRQDGMELGCFAVFGNLANLGGYEAGIVVRYQGPQKFYRIAVSSLWKEIILWRSSGGVVQVVPYPFEVGKSYALAVECQGSHIRVTVDGKELISWWDTAEPIGAGRVGLASKEGEAYFTAVKVEPLPAAASAKPPVHVPRFREQQWHGLRFFFDGNEPVFVLTPRNLLDLMKFRPGYRPILYAFNYITDWSRFYPTRTNDYKVVKDGAQLIIETKADDPKTKSAITQDARLVVSYDAAKDLYTYDHTCTTHIPNAEEAGKVSPSWDHGDSVFLGGVGSSITRDPNAAKPTYQWSVFEAPDDKFYKVPMNHNSHYDGTAGLNGGPVKAGGFGMVVVGDPVLSPIVRIPELAANFERTSSIGHCGWAYDIHTMFTPKKVNAKVPPGDYVSRVVYTGMNAAEAQAMLAKADFYKPRDLTLRIPVFAAGTTGLVETFDRIVLLASPHTEYRIWSGVIDDKVGHGDRSSLRLDGPTEAWTLTGGSYFSGGYAKKVRVSGWVKTQDVQGDGPTIGFSHVTDGKFEFYTTGITGTHDWTPFSYVTSFPGESWGVDLYWRNGGPGTVWFDDFKVEWLDDKAEVSPSRDYPLKPANADIVLNWNGQGTARSVIDASGYGSHGKFHGDISWADVDGKRVLTLDGKTGYIWPLSSHNLTLGPDTTMVFDLKPEAGGYLIQWGFGFNYIIEGSAPKFQICYQAAGKNVKSKPILDANVWQKLAIVVTKDKIALYINGKLADEMSANTFPGNPMSHLSSTWHRHLSFFGAGSADYGLLPEGPTGCMKGQVRSVTVYKRALTAEEIAGR